MYLKRAASPWDSLFLLRARLHFLPGGHKAKLSRPPEHRHLCHPRRIMETPPADHAEKQGQARQEERGAPFPWQAGDLEGRPGGQRLGRTAEAGRVGLQAGGGGGQAGRAPTAHVILPQASLSGFLGCNWSCPACAPRCQAELSEWGKGEEGWIPAPSPCSLGTRGGEGSPSTRRPPGSGPALPGPARLGPSPPPPARRNSPRPRLSRSLPARGWVSTPGAILSGLQDQVPCRLCLLSWRRACHPPGLSSTKLSLVSLARRGGDRGGVPPSRGSTTSSYGAVFHGVGLEEPT